MDGLYGAPSGSGGGGAKTVRVKAERAGSSPNHPGNPNCGSRPFPPGNREKASV